MKITIWHNPRCSKSRQALLLLRERGFDPEIIDYQKNPPSAAEIRQIAIALGLPLSSFVRSSEKIYSELSLASAAEEELIAAMVEHPILIERPIVIANGKAVLGRPPENVLGLV